MEKVRKRANRIPALGASMVRKAWVDIALFLLAGVIIGSGVYLRTQPERTTRTDLREYNKGTSTCQLLLWEPLFSPETLPSLSDSSEETPPSPPLSSEEMILSVYPHVIEKAGPYFEKAASDGADKKLKSLALYNLGTMLGRLALAEGLPSARRSDMTQALTKLGEAIRNDPNNEDAKFNLELLERAVGVEEKPKGSAGPGYSPGAVDEGY